jgi:hypothetical protein
MVRASIEEIWDSERTEQPCEMATQRKKENKKTTAFFTIYFSIKAISYNLGQYFPVR